MAHEAPAAHFSVQMGERGRLVLPAKVRRQLGLQPGDRLVLQVDSSGELRLLSLRSQVRQFRGAWRHISPERKLSEELLADRQREAATKDGE